MFNDDKARRNTVVTASNEVTNTSAIFTCRVDDLYFFALGKLFTHKRDSICQSSWSMLSCNATKRRGGEDQAVRLLREVVQQHQKHFSKSSKGRAGAPRLPHQKRHRDITRTRKVLIVQHCRVVVAVLTVHFVISSSRVSCSGKFLLRNHISFPRHDAYK